MTLCETCKGRGTVTSPTVQGDDVTEREYLEGLAEVECPAGCVAIEYHIPESLLLWCTTHRASSVELPGDGPCWAEESLRTGIRCHIVPYEMPTEPLGKLT